MADFHSWPGTFEQYNQTPSEDRYPSIKLNLKPILWFCLLAVPLGAIAVQTDQCRKRM